MSATTDRVTISIPSQLRASAAHLAEREGKSFSAFISSAVEDHIRGLLLDEWLAEQAAERGGWDEEELKKLAEETGIPYLPPGRPWSR
jgi:predicted DNA-binding protein